MIFENNTYLIKSLQKGNEKAYHFLIEKYHKKLSAYAVSLTGNYAAAQDIVQNVFIKTWEYRKRLSVDFSIEGFLHKSVYNEFVTVYNKQKSMSKLESKFVEYLNKSFEETTSNDIEKIVKKVNDSIEKLPKKCKEVFVLSKKEGLTNLEIANFLNISVKTVENQITKAFKILRAELNMNNKSILFFLVQKNVAFFTKNLSQS